MLRSKPVLAFLSWVVVALLTEGITRAAYALREVPPTRDESLAEEWRWVKRHLETGRETLPGSAVYDPRLGWRTSPEQRTGNVDTNSAGMRADREFPLERQPGLRRLLLLGDSYTFGVGVPDEQTFGRLLQDAYLPDWEILNLAVSGYGTDQQLLSFEYEGRRYRPDVVALGFFVRDYSRNLMRFRGYAKPRFVLDPAGNLRLEGSPVQAPAAFLAAYASGAREIRPRSPSYVVELLLERLAEIEQGRIDEDAEGWRLLAALMDRFARSVRESGAKPLWLLIPSRDMLTGESDRFAALERLVERRAAEIGLPYLSLTPALRRSDAPDARVYDPREAGGHFSAHGNRVAARAIHAYLEQQGWTDGVIPVPGVRR
jgi:lysophospholipase L1-like esterase